MDFSVDPASLRSDGRLVAAIRAEAAGDLDRLHGATASGGPAVWGPDTPVAGVYAELTAATGEVLDLLDAVLGAGGAGVEQMADAYERAEDTARDRLRRIDRRDPGAPP